MHADLMKTREQLYRFLSKVYLKEVDTTFFHQMKAMTFPGECGEPELSSGYAILKEYFENCGGDPVTDLAVDYAKIFLSAGISQGTSAFPYESVHTSEERIVMQSAWDQMCDIYTKYGMTKGNVTSDVMEDHIALELEFMAYLCEEAQKDPNHVEWMKQQQDFLTHHLLNWVPGFCAQLEQCADTRFYKGISKITNGFLKLDLQILEKAIDSFAMKDEATAQYYVETQRINEILSELKKEYKVYAPKRFPNRGAKKGTDLVRYGEIQTIDEIVTEVQSDFSPKEIFYPITQTMITFKDDVCEESIPEDSKGFLIFARPCDILSIKRLDTIFLRNGRSEDAYYARLRNKVKVVMMECVEGFENCFCVSMGSNRTDNYNLAIRFLPDGVMVASKDADLDDYFKEETKRTFVPEFVKANKKNAILPKIEGREELKAACNLEFWKEYDEKCIGCGGCNTVCGTCSCFDTVDVLYNEDVSSDGERRRVWSSCMLDTYTMTAGGGRSRKTPGENMRFKTLHKVYDYNLRFQEKEHMCVGCGRCDMRCPKEISYFDAINRLSQEMDLYRSTNCSSGGRNDG